MDLDTRIRFCNLCGAPAEIAIPPGDNRQRQICSSCGEIQYQNPKIVTGCVPIWQNKILLCKRAIEPRRGLWTVPAGFMENGESVQAGAARETFEEACAVVNNLQLYGIYNLAHISQVYVMFLGQLDSEDGFGVGEESLETALFSEDNIPWSSLAFRVVEETLRRYLQERAAGEFPIRVIDI